MGEGVADGEKSGSVSTRIRRLIDESKTVVIINWVASGFSKSRFADTGEKLVTTTRNSRLHRWLTKELKPEVITVDLRETRTVGPFIRLLDAVFDHLEPYWHESRLRQALVGVDRGIEKAADTRIGGIVACALTPPNQPNRDDGHGGNTDDHEPADHESRGV